MKSTSLKGRIAAVAAVDPDRTALVTGTGALSYGALADVRWTGAAGGAVAVVCADLAQATRAMVALDGVASAICVMSVTLPESHVAVLLERWSFDTVLTDCAADLPGAFAEAGVAVVDVTDGLATGGAVPEGPETLWLVPTSGTTATPKLVEHRLSSLARAALAAGAVAPAPQTWALFYDVSRFAGYQVFFHALISGHRLVFPGLDGSMEERVAFCAAQGVTHVSATPTLWRKILMCPASAELPLQQITLGGEAADQPILTALADRFPQARVTHIYASTEAGVGFAVSDARAGFPLRYADEGFGGVEIRLDDDRLRIRTAGGARSYSGGQAFADADGWVDTGDMVRVDGDRFFVIGRESGIINVGGDKVVPEQVRAALLECPLVADAVVYGKKNPFTGALVVADVKLSPDADAATAKDSIDAFARDTLPAAQVPRVIRLVDDIQYNATGKGIAPS